MNEQYDWVASAADEIYENIIDAQWDTDWRQHIEKIIRWHALDEQTRAGGNGSLSGKPGSPGTPACFKTSSLMWLADWECTAKTMADSHGGVAREIAQAFLSLIRNYRAILSSGQYGA